METALRTPKAKAKHIVLFVVACIFLAAALFFAYTVVAIRLTPVQFEDQTEEYGVMMLVGVAIGAAAYVFASALMLGFFVLFWCGGTVISTLLAVRRGDKPRWLWASSLVLALLYAALFIGLMAVWLLF